MSHANISVFIPHSGCPNQCSFCNQKKITGTVHQPSPAQVGEILKVAAENHKHRPQDTEIAFFGGSFTAIDRKYMVALLDVAQKYLQGGRFCGIRVSTRPDCISAEILNLLKAKGVTSIELGAQSMDNDVLRANLRGHTREDVVRAAKLIRDFGISLGLQMMTGLYKSTKEKDRRTAELLAGLGPNTMRIYPTVVMKDTLLQELYESGEYVPYSFEETVELCADLLEFFAEKSIPVIRLGLQDSTSLKNGSVAGVWHPAFREICENRIFFKKFLDISRKQKIGPGKVCVYVHPKATSKMIGQKRENLKKLAALGYDLRVKPDESLGKFEIRMENCR